MSGHLVITRQQKAPVILSRLSTMNLRSLVKDSALYTVVNVLNKGISIILLPIYTFFLSPEQFGLVDYLAAIGAIVAVTVSLEVTQALARYLPEQRKASGDTSPLISAAILSMLVTFALFIIPTILFAQRFRFYCLIAQKTRT